MTKNSIEFLDIQHIPGPNLWAYFPVLLAHLEITAADECCQNAVPGWQRRIETWLPGVARHQCNEESHADFLKMLRNGTSLAHLIEHVTLELQSVAGLQSGFGRARATPSAGVYRVILEARQPIVGRAALHMARDLVMAAIEGRDFDVLAAREALVDLVETHWLGPSTAAIVIAAEARNIPAMRLNDGNLVQLGYGASQRRIWTAETDSTSAIAEGISRDKDLTKSLLEICGVPVPEGRLVRSPADAWEAAEDIGVPVVVKPYDGNHGRGVFTNLTTQEQVETAYAVALDEGSGVIVEKFIQGVEHRLLVVGGRLVAANKGDEAKVIGDGQSSIYELIQSQINSDPRRGTTEEHPLNLIRVNSGSLLEITRQGYADESAIPELGVEVMIQRSGNHAFDVTDEVHPDTAEVVALAAKIVGLDIAGIDLVATDISRPLAEQRAAIVEVNAGPSLLMHIKPAVGKSRPVGQAIINNLFADGDNGRIPVVGVAGSHGRTLVARLIARLLRLGGRQTGVASSEGLFIDQRLIEQGDQARWAPAQRLLMNRNIEAMVCDTSESRIYSEGLPYDRCQIGVVLGIDLATPVEPVAFLGAKEQRFNAVRTQIDVVLPTGVGVLNAEDTLVADMARLCDGEVMFFAIDPENSVLVQHLGAGGRGVTVRYGHIVLCSGLDAISLMPVSALPAGAADEGTLAHVLAATAAAWSLNVSHDLLRVGLETFDQTLLARIAG
jgi:cyanophycin synthetase